MAVINKQYRNDLSIKKYQTDALFNDNMFGNSQTINRYLYPLEYDVCIDDRFNGSNPCWCNNAIKNRTYAITPSAYDSYITYKGYTFTDESGNEWNPCYREAGTVVYRCQPFEYDGTEFDGSGTIVGGNIIGTTTSIFDGNYCSQLDIYYYTQLTPLQIEYFRIVTTKTDGTTHTDDYMISDFIDRQFPKRLFIELQAPGGGGSCGKLSEYMSGSGGGGGAYLAIVLDTSSHNWKWRITVEGKAGGGNAFTTGEENGYTNPNMLIKLSTDGTTYTNIVSVGSGHGGYYKDPSAPTGTEGKGGEGGKCYKIDPYYGGLTELISDGDIIEFGGNPPSYNKVAYVIATINGADGGKGKKYWGGNGESGESTTWYSEQLSNVYQWLTRGDYNGGTYSGEAGGGGASTFFNGGNATSSGNRGGNGKGGSGGAGGQHNSNQYGGESGKGACIIHINGKI